MYLKAGLIVTVLVLAFASNPVFADTRDFSKCGYGRCFQYVPEENQAPVQQVNPNWMFDLFMPNNTCNLTGTMDIHGNCSVGSITLSDGNWTLMKNNVGVESVENIHTVISNPSTGYCKVGLFTINNEDGYLYRVYNNATGLDLTGYMYPTFCHIETGPNPINGDKSIPSIPEFGQIASIILAISVLVGIVVTSKSMWSRK